MVEARDEVRLEVEKLAWAMASNSDTVMTTHRTTTWFIMRAFGSRRQL